MTGDDIVIVPIFVSGSCVNVTSEDDKDEFDEKFWIFIRVIGEHNLLRIIPLDNIFILR